MDWSKIKVYGLIGGGIVPAGAYRPLTREERISLYFKDTYGKGAIARAFFVGTVRQIRSTTPSWDGADGYAQQVTTRYVAHVVRKSTEASIQGLLGHEPRYLPCNCSGFLPRFGHSILYSFITIDQHGRRVPDVGRIVGRYAGEFAIQGLSPGPFDQWHAVRASTHWMAWGWVFNTMREFSPEIRRKFHIHQ